ncbi:MAG: GNAT family N-acetyltransferase, partial [Rubrobacter sp.]
MTGLPEGYTTRAPRLEDAEMVTALISASELADTGASDMSLEELLDDWHPLDLAEEAVVVVAPDGRAAGYADVINRSFVTVSVYGYVHPDHRELGIGAYLISWGERWTRGRMSRAPENARVVVQHYISRINRAAQRLFEGLDYTPVRGIYVMETTLEEAPPQPRWPAGITVRNFVPEQDERAVFEAVEDAFR